MICPTFLPEKNKRFHMAQLDRLEWTDMDWANYLNCSIEKINEYKKILSANIVMEIKQISSYPMYEFQIYRRVTGQKGRKRKTPVFFDWSHQSHDRTEVVNNANIIISSLTLKDEIATKFNVPKAAVQMMLIREK